MTERYTDIVRRLVAELQPITQYELRYLGRLKGIEHNLEVARRHLVIRKEIRRARPRVQCGITGKLIYPYVSW